MKEDEEILCISKYDISNLFFHIKEVDTLKNQPPICNIPKQKFKSKLEEYYKFDEDSHYNV